MCQRVDQEVLSEGRGGTAVGQFRRRYAEVRPFVRGRDELVALKMDIEGKEEGR